jgi:hypothetical protein
MSGDILVGNDDRLAAAQQGCDLGAGSLDKSRPDKNVVGALAQVDA